MNTKTLIADYANQLVDGMDLDALCEFAYETIVDNLEQLSENELIDRVQEYAPHLLDN